MYVAPLKKPSKITLNLFSLGKVLVDEGQWFLSTRMRKVACFLTVLATVVTTIIIIWIVVAQYVPITALKTNFVFLYFRGHEDPKTCSDGLCCKLY